MKPLTIIVMVHNGLGDVVMTLPLLEAIDRALPPGSNLVLVAKTALEASFLQLFRWRNSPEIVVVGQAVGPERSLSAALRRVRLALTLRRKRADIFIGGVMPASLAASAFSLLVGARFSIGQEGPWRRLGYSKGHPWPECEHKVPYYARFAELAGLADSKAALPFPAVEPGATATADALKPPVQKLILLAPGSGGAEVHKRWPGESFAQLARRLLDQSPDVRVGIFGSVRELSLLQEVAAGVGPHPRCEIMLARRIEDSLKMVGEAQCVVSGCTSSVHLAALLGRPVVGIYGPTNPSITGPYSDKATIVRLGLACSPCYNPRFTTGCGNPICMTLIDVARVQSAVMDALNGRFGVYPRNIKTTHAIAPDPAISAR